MLLPDQSGVAQGINQGSSALANALQQAMAYRVQESQRKNLASQFGPDTLMGKILGQPGGLGAVKALGPMGAQAVKFDEASRYSQGIDDEFTPVKPTQGQPVTTPDQGQQQQQGVLEGVVGTQQQPQTPRMPQGQGQPQQAPKSAIEEVKAAVVKDGNLEEATVEDSDYVTTKSGNVLKKSDFIKTPIGTYHSGYINALSRSPNRGDQEKAKMINKHFAKQEEVIGKEGIQIRKEWRNKIDEASKPFNDLEKLDMNVKQMEAAKNLISNSKDLSRDDNWVRTVSQAIADNSGKEGLTRLLKSDDQNKLYSLMYDFFRSKEIGGSNPSTKEVQLAIASKPSQYTGKRANIAIINTMLEKAERDLEKAKIMAKKKTSTDVVNPDRFKLDVFNELQPFNESLTKKYAKEEKVLDTKEAMKDMIPSEGRVHMINEKGQGVSVLKKNIKRRQNEGWVLINGK